MQFTTLATLLALGASSLFNGAVASPAAKSLLTEKANILGPASYEELQELVSKQKLHKRQYGGLYMCTDAHFLGDCFYGVYPLEIDFHLSEYYRTRITSVGPDQGTQCVFSDDYDNCGRFGYTQLWFSYPGGNLTNPVNDNLRCFWCRVAR